jgi:hypothetical protein
VPCSVGARGIVVRRLAVGGMRIVIDDQQRFG